MSLQNESDYRIIGSKHRHGSHARSIQKLELCRAWNYEVFLPIIYIHTVIIWFIKMIYRYIYIYARLSTCSHSQESQLLRHVWYNSATFGGAGWQTSRNFCPQMSLDTVLYYPGWRNMAQLQDITRHQPEKNEDTHTGIRVRKIRQFRSILCSI